MSVSGQTDTETGDATTGGSIDPPPPGAILVAAGPAVYVSTTGGDPGSWVENPIPSNFFLGSDIATDGAGRFVVVDDIAGVVYSDNGAMWSDATTPYPVAPDNDIIYGLGDVEYCNGHWVAVGGTGFVSFDDGVSLYSDDGETFSLASGAGDEVRSGVACDPGTGVWIAVAGNSALRSDDNGATWSVQGAVPLSPHGVATAGGVWISVGGFSSSTIGRTTDVTQGVDWMEVTPPQSEVLHAVATDGATTFVATGENGAIIQSSDAGVTWEDASLATSESLGAVAWLPYSERFAVGDSAGNLRFSDDGGLTWGDPVPTGSDRPVGGIASVP